MKKLFKNKKGFTLMEMLIVVAIIVILVAVSMPVFTNQLNKAKKAADEANERAAKAVATATYLTADPQITATESYVYDAVNGKLVDMDDRASVIKYGKQETGIIKVEIEADGNVKLTWVNTGTEAE